MLQISARFYCKIAKQQISELPKISKPSKLLDFKQLHHPTKVPQTPVPTAFPDATNNSEIEIDAKTIQLLERLSLVDLDSEQALATLKSSIQFADKIEHIDTHNVRPLYTVLEHQQLQLRNDRVAEGDCREQLLRIAKVTDEDYYVSPPGNIPLEQLDK
ncbi:glutamyl-tRNA(Gln) amidotransferase subunit C, mitochondrial [Drosophila grimshawi]|uniref:Glutamyl-tRNA(Gln) amidotransferase subunit C, mitochondrial n=1 Tax=Drosophila grimshawi TaxID=7222 RepID=GATC_DROGR|nr:glutamyl-tRNA(Gln) amidotransferase subunit C, mitochondrial [Drosophila grimshawi]B4JCX8.1 RecName: Full=Glutamyl-tRNA(Gln) amidotransferase subunit C, mitochondrial; Short=Glu-AdT subunit C [Drosophila grimshawi]EDW03217.1 GH10615 [Drosophila grimshawi]